MGLSDASWFAATVAILLGIYIGERILDIDFSVFLAKNRFITFSVNFNVAGTKIDTVCARSHL